jgi:UDP-3-O-[3-hydroxymyristoyl] glucosamine N-acyltransferase
LKLRELAERLDCRLEGDGESTSAASPASSTPRLAISPSSPIRNIHQHLARLSASAIILSDQAPAEGMRASLLRSADPYLAFAKAVVSSRTVLHPHCAADPLSAVSATATLGADVSIGAFVVIGDGAVVGARTIVFPNAVIGPGAIIGDDCVVHAHVSIRERVRIGHRVIVQDGAVVGGDGFGFVRQPDGTHFKIPQHGDVVVEDDVEIGANTTIDRPRGRRDADWRRHQDRQPGADRARRDRRQARVIRRAGRHRRQHHDRRRRGVGGTGRRRGHLRIGKGVVATAQTGVPNSVDAGTMISGYPAIPNRDWLKASAVFRQLPALKKRVAELEDRLAELEAKR